MPRTDEPIDRQILKELVKRVGRLERARSKTPLRNQAAAAAAAGGFPWFAATSLTNFSSTSSSLLSMDDWDDTSAGNGGEDWAWDGETLECPAGVYMTGGGGQWKSLTAGIEYRLASVGVFGGFSATGIEIGQTDWIPSGIPFSKSPRQSCCGVDIYPDDVTFNLSVAQDGGTFIFDNRHWFVMKLG